MRRILTNRNFTHPKSFEALLLSDNGVVFWEGEEWSLYLYEGTDEECPMIFSIAVDIDFIKEKFAECGRTFDPSKIPNLVSYPYACWL